MVMRLVLVEKIRYAAAAAVAEQVPYIYTSTICM